MIINPKSIKKFRKTTKTKRLCQMKIIVAKPFLCGMSLRGDEATEGSSL